MSKNREVSNTRITNDATYLDEKSMPLSLLSPYSSEFINRLNKENLWYLNQLTDFYIAYQAAAEKASQEEMLKTALLERYLNDLETEVRQFQKLLNDINRMDKERSEALPKVKLIDFSHLENQIDMAMQYLVGEREQWRKRLRQITEHVDKSRNKLQNKYAEYAQTLQEYVHENIPVKNYRPIDINFQFTENERAKFGDDLQATMTLESQDLRQIINDFSAGIIDGTILLSKQSEGMQQSIKDLLKQKLKALYSAFLTESEQEAFADRNLETKEVGKAIVDIADMLNEHIADQDVKNDSKLNFHQSEIAELEFDLDQALKEQEATLEMISGYEQNIMNLTKFQAIIDQSKLNPNASPEVADQINENGAEIVKNILKMPEKYNESNLSTKAEKDEDSVTVRPK